jgi:integrase
MRKNNGAQGRTGSRLFEYPKGSKVWWIRYWDADGREHSEKVGPKRLAHDRYMQRKTEIREGRYFPNAHKCAVHFDDLLDDYRDAKERQGKAIMRTDIGFRRLVDRFGGRRADSITAAEIEEWQSDLTERMSIASVNHHLQLFRAILLRAVANRRVRREDVPAMRLENPNNKRVRYLSDEEESRLMPELPEWFRPLVTLAIHTGMRKGEMLKLKWGDVDFQTGTIHVREAKSGEGRSLPMNSVARAALVGLREARRERLRARVVNRNEAAAYVSAAPEGGFLYNLNRYWYAALKRAGIENLHVHDLRHTFATRYMKAGGNLFSLQTLLGHKTAAMVQRYSHLDQKHLQAEVERLAAPGPKPWVDEREPHTADR